MAKTLILAAVVFVQILQVVYCGQTVRVVLSGRSIPSNDVIWGNSEPYLKVYYKFEQNSNYISNGQTAVKKGQQNPDWTEQFSFDFVESPDKIQGVKFELWDKDWLYDDHMGDVEITLRQLVSEASASGDGIVSRGFDKGKGTLLIKTTL